MVVLWEQWVLAEQPMDNGVVTGCPATSTLGVHVRLDSIWMMFMNVVSCLNVLSSTNNFHDVGAMISSMYYSGREPVCCHCLLQKQFVLHIVGLFAVTCTVMVSCTLGCSFF